MARSVLAWKSHGQRSLVGYSPQGCRESDMTEWLTASPGSLLKRRDLGSSLVAGGWDTTLAL